MQPTENFMKTVLGKVFQMHEQVIAMSSMMGDAFQGVGRRFNDIEHAVNRIAMRMMREEVRTKTEGIEDIAHRFDNI